MVGADLVKEALIADAARAVLARMPKEDLETMFAKAIRDFIEKAASSWEVSKELDKELSKHMKAYLAKPEVQSNFKKRVEEIGKKAVEKALNELEAKVKRDLEYWNRERR